MTKYIKFSLRKLGFWLLAVSTGVVFFSTMASAALTFSSTPAITSATFESTGSVTGLVVEFNRPVWNDAALTGALEVTDFVYNNVSGDGAASITAIAHTAGDDFAVLTLNADPGASDTNDTISALANNIFTVGGALSEKTVSLTDDAGTVPAITSATVLNGKPRILVTFNKRVWSDDTSGAPPTTAPAVADFTLANGGSAEGCEPALGANLIARPGARSLILDCGENAVADEAADTFNAANGTSLNDAWGNDMLGTGGPGLTQDAVAPTIVRAEAVKDSTAVLITFSEPVFTDDPAATNNPSTLATGATDFTYSNGSATAGGTAISAITTGTGFNMMIGDTGSGNNYALITTDTAVSVADLLGGVADDTIVAAGATNVYDANGNAMAASGPQTLNDTTKPVLLSATINKSGATGQNTLALLYSEDVTTTGFPAGGESIASTTTVGNMTTACQTEGFGAFSGNSGNLTYKTLKNTVALNAAQTTFTITLAAQSGGYRTSTAAAAACTDGTGDTFTPSAVIADVAPTPNTIEAASLLKTHTITSAWDTANPLTSAVATPSSATTTTATIGWTAIGASSDFREYKFFYGTTTGAGALLAGTQWGVADDAALTTIGTTTTTLTGLNSGTIYFITPYAIDTFGNAAAAAAEMNIQTNSSQVSTDKVPPATPTDVKVESKDGKAVLTWVDPTATDLKDIVVLRGKNEFPVSGTPYAIALKGAKTYTDSDVVAGDKVKYILRARDNANNESANSTEVSVTIVAVTPAVETPPAEEVVPPAEEKPALSEEEQKAAEEAAKKLEKALEKAQAQLAKYEAKVELYKAKLDKFLAKKKTKTVKKAIKKYNKLVAKYNALVEKYNAKIEALQQ